MVRVALQQLLDAVDVELPTHLLGSFLEQVIGQGHIVFPDTPCRPERGQHVFAGL